MAPLPLWFKASCWLMSAYFVVCVLLQYNDPDPIRWMVIYGTAAIASAMLPAKSWSGIVPAVSALIGLVAMVWSITLVRSIWGQVALADIVEKMSEKGGAVEVEREAGGLAIEAVWLLLAATYRVRRR